MAKSLRSKVKRKMRAIKRAKNAPRELARLKKILGLDGEQDEEMKDLYTKGRDVLNILMSDCFIFTY